jgi:uncharacterized protein
MAEVARRANTREEILTYLQGEKNRLQRRFHIRKIALIGSFAREEQGPESDIDFLVDIEEGTPDLYDLKRSLKTELENRFRRPVEIASERYLKSYYRDQIIKDAIYI